jgi:hypothetical protein
MARLRLNEFYYNIANCNNEDELNKICKIEKEFIYNNYSSLESKKSAFTNYRNSFFNNYLKNNFNNYDNISKAIKEIHKNKINKDIEILKIAGKYHVSIIDLKNNIKKYYAIRSLTLSSEEIKNINVNYKIKVVKKHSNLKLIKNPDDFINKAIELLNSKSYITRVLAISLLSGRRVAEIGCTAEFVLINKNIVMFKGQLKTKERECKPYQIPLLAKPKLIIDCLKEIRIDKPQYINNPTLFHSNCSKVLSIGVKKYFSEFVESNITPKDLRAIYATIACSRYKKDSRKTPQLYYSEILGHSEDDLNTCNSYFDYCLD